MLNSGGWRGSQVGFSVYKITAKGWQYRSMLHNLNLVADCMESH